MNLRCRATRLLQAAMVVALIAPIGAVATDLASAGPSAAAVPGPQSIPSDLWDAPTPAGVAGSYIWIEGAPGDTVVGDRDLLLPGVFSAGQPPGVPGPYAGLVVARSSGPSFWTGEFWGTDASTQPGVGYYPNAVSLADRVDGVAGFGWWDALAGAHQPCATVTGWFAIDKIVHSGTTVTDLDLRFEQSCNGGPAIHGKVHLDSNQGPVDPIPSGLWDVTPPSVSGNYTFIDGTPGDPVSGGVDVVLQDPLHPGIPADYQGEIAAIIGSGVDQDFWVAEFQKVGGQTVLRRGYYPNLPLATVMNPPAGLRVTHIANGQKACDPGTTTGWFAIDHIGRIDGQITRLDLRFEQTCNGNPPLHGRIHLDAGGLDEGSPVGAFESAVPVTGGVKVDGWALDPETVSAISVDVLVDGVVKTSLTASDDRPDVGTANPLYGNGHGFSANVAVPTGTHQVCVTARNTGVGSDATLGCKTVKVGAGSPFGSFDAAFAGPTSVNVSGWAIDPDTSLPIPVHVYVDAAGSAFTADGFRPDVEGAIPGYGAAHGFSGKVTTTPGTHNVCAYAINTGAGSNVALGCKTVTVLSGSPIGSLDAVSLVPGVGFNVGGWALDPDTGTSIPVHVYVDGTGVALTASGNRPDIGAVFPGYGSAHGFSATVPAGPGQHTVCAYGINTGAGANVSLGCRVVSMPTGSPIGSLDVMFGGKGTVSAGGWTADPDTAAPIAVHLYVCLLYTSPSPRD